MARQYYTIEDRRTQLEWLNEKIARTPAGDEKRIGLIAQRDSMAKSLAEHDAAAAEKAREREAKRAAREARREAQRATSRTARTAKRYDMAEPLGAGLGAETGRLHVRMLRAALSAHCGDLMRAAASLNITERQALYIIKKHAAPITDASVDDLLS